MTRTTPWPWAIPGTPGMEHRIGGLEKQDITGNVSYDAANHQRMTDLRRLKVEKVADYIPPIEPHGPGSGDLLVLGWGGTYGSIVTAVENVRKRGGSVSAAHLRYLNPMPKNHRARCSSGSRRGFDPRAEHRPAPAC